MAYSMNIQYGNMNPLSEVTDRAFQGMQLGMQMRKMNREEQASQTPNIPFSDPGQRQMVDPKQVFAPEAKDLSRYENMMKQLNKIKDPVLKEQIIQSMSQSSSKAMDTPLMKGALQSKIDPKDIQLVLNRVVNGDPHAGDDIEILKAQSNNNPTFVGAIEAKKSEIQNIQKKMDDEYALKLKTHLNDIAKLTKDIQDGTYKGQASPDVLNAIQNYPNRLAELSRIPGNEKWIMDYLNERKQSSGRGGAADKFEYRVDENGKLGVFRNGLLDKSQSNPDFTLTGATPISQQDFMMYMIKGTMPTKGEARGVPTKKTASGKQLEKIASDELQERYYKEELKKSKDESTAIQKTRERLRKEGYTNI